MGRGLRILKFVMLTVALSLPIAVAAQAPPKPNEPVIPKGDQPGHDTCGDNRTTVGQGGVATEKADGRNLSERLAQSNGVICPPSYVDPQIKAPTPPGGSMPVIPPPGSPGGDRNIQPK